MNKDKKSTKTPKVKTITMEEAIEQTKKKIEKLVQEDIRKAKEQQK